MSKQIKIVMLHIFMYGIYKKVILLVNSLKSHFSMEFIPYDIFFSYSVLYLLGLVGEIVSTVFSFSIHHFINPLWCPFIYFIIKMISSSWMLPKLQGDSGVSLRETQ
jgi:hypothetical protein